MVNTKIIADLPMELGIKRTYKGYFFLIAALELAITDQKNLLYMSKSIFPVIASRYDTTYSCIERNIRTAINACWNSPDHREKTVGNVTLSSTEGSFRNCFYRYSVLASEKSGRR